MDMTSHDLSFLTRRQFLFAAGAAGFLGINFPQLLAQEVVDATADQCILVWLAGGPSHIDTFDPKPGHKNNGPFKAIRTAAAGIQLSEHLPTLAKQMKNAALIRSMTSREGSHQRATYYMHTGYKPLGTIEHPSMGAMVVERKGKKNEDLPAFVSIGRKKALGAGYLGTRFQPFIIGDPSNPSANLKLPKNVSRTRQDRRMKLLEGINSDYLKTHKGEVEIEAYDSHYLDAVRLMRSKSLSALDLSRERQSVRERYGDDNFAKGCLLARRMIDVGVRFVEISLAGWDTHADNFERTKVLSQRLDRGLGSLIGDLKASGRLDRTLIVCIGEFGRTPRINAREGRDHYPRVFSALVAGGGVKGGQVIGASSADGGAVRDRAVSVGDLHATICHALGIDPDYEYQSPGGRPFRIVDKGKPVTELF